MSTSAAASELDVLRAIAWQGSRRAAEALGQFSGNTLTVAETRACVVPFEQMPYLTGDPQEVVVGVDFAVSGAIDGFLLAFFPAHDAMLLLNALMGAPGTPLTELDEMMLSALGEAGNIIVSSFLSSLEGLCALDVVPSPPSVAVEMAGAILTSAVHPLLEDGGEVLLVEADIVPVGAIASQSASCRILFLPTTASWTRLRKAFVSSRMQ